MLKRFTIAVLILFVLVSVQTAAQAPPSGSAKVERHNNEPRRILSPVGTVFTPPSSFGNWWITTSTGGQTIACPPDIADGDGMSIHIQQGAGAPYSPAISFATPCYGWAAGVQPTWSSVANQEDWVFCQSMNPPATSGASFICAPQLAAKPSTPPTSVWQTPGGANCHSSFVLSNNNLTATESTGGWFTCRATTPHTTGQYYFFATMSAVTAGGGWIIGFENASGSLISFPGSDLNGIGAQPMVGAIWFNGKSTGTGTHPIGSVIRIDVDLTNHFFGYAVNGAGEEPGGCVITTGVNCVNFSKWAGGAAYPVFAGFGGGTPANDTAILNTISGIGPGGSFVLWQ